MPSTRDEPPQSAPEADLRAANEQLVLAALREQGRAEVSEAARLRSVFLVKASRLLAGVFDPDETLQGLARLAVPTLGDFCFLDVVGAHGAIERSGWAHADPVQHASIDEVHRRVPAYDWRIEPVVEALATAEPVVVTDVTDEWLRSVATSSEHLAFMRAAGVRSLMTVPLVAGGQTVGTMTFGFTTHSGRRYTPEALTLATDLADRAALAVDSARLNRELRQAVQVRDDFLASTAHDLRTPLTIIQARAQLLRRQVARAAQPASPGGAPHADLIALLLHDLAPALGQIETAAVQMTRLIGALLDAARLDAGKTLQLQKLPTDLVALVRRIVAEHAASRTEHEISVETDEAALVGQWDSQRLERVFENLVGNAIKYSPAGGPVVVTVARALRAGGVGGTGDTQEVAVVTVRDTGVGIPAAEIAHVFERFRRGTNVAGRIAGTGIGLADVSQVIAEHGGSITVESRAAGSAAAGPVESGTTFTVRLPLGEASADPAPP